MTMFLIYCTYISASRCSVFCELHNKEKWFEWHSVCVYLGFIFLPGSVNLLVQSHGKGHSQELQISATNQSITVQEILHATKYFTHTHTQRSSSPVSPGHP